MLDPDPVLEPEVEPELEPEEEYDSDSDEDDDDEDDEEEESEDEDEEEEEEDSSSSLSSKQLRSYAVTFFFPLPALHLLASFLKSLQTCFPLVVAVLREIDSQCSLARQ